MILYIILSFLVELGMIIEFYSKRKTIPLEAWLILAFSPITLPIIIGMKLFNKK